MIGERREWGGDDEREREMRWKWKYLPMRVACEWQGGIFFAHGIKSSVHIFLHTRFCDTSSVSHYSGEDFTSKLKCSIRLHIYLTVSLRHRVYRCKFTIRSVQPRENQHFPSIIQHPPLTNFSSMTADSNSWLRCSPASLETTLLPTEMYGTTDE